MSVNFPNVNPYCQTGAVGASQFCENTNSINPDFKLNQLEQDTFESSVKKEGKTTEEKQALVKKARQQSSAWSILFGVFSPIYYALRSEDKIAEKFNLDSEQDKDLIKKIKQEQVLFSLPGIIGAGLLTLIVSSALDSKNIDVSKT